MNDRYSRYQRPYYMRNLDRLRGTQRCIRDARKVRGYTQTQLARLIGVAQPVISLWERGMVPADWPRLYEVLPELEAAR